MTASPLPVLGVQKETPLAEWERRLLEQVRLLRLDGKHVSLVVQFNGPVMLISVARPLGRVETT